MVKYYMNNTCEVCENSCHKKAQRCKKCQNLRHSQLIKGKNNPNYKNGQTLNNYCLDCHKKLSNTNYKSIRCQSCENIKRFKGRTYEEMYGEEKANKLRLIRRANLLGIKRSLETKSKLSYIKGGTGIPYEYSKYDKNIFTEELKEKIRERDGRICQICGMFEIENCKKLDVHHIDYNKKNCNEENLIALCLVCHRFTNSNRKMWQIFLSNIMLLRKAEE